MGSIIPLPSPPPCSAGGIRTFKGLESGITFFCGSNKIHGGPVNSLVRGAIYIFQGWILRVQEVSFFLNSQIMNKYGQDFVDILSVRYISFDW